MIIGSLFKHWLLVAHFPAKVVFIYLFIYMYKTQLTTVIFDILTYKTQLTTEITLYKTKKKANREIRDIGIVMAGW